jgi:hypothetical protein
MTDALAAASTAIRYKLSLQSIPRSEWTYAQRVEYNKEIAQLILQNPDVFSSTDVNTARDVRQKQYSPIEDESLSLSMFTDEVLNNAVKITAVGGETLRKALYFAVVVGVSYLALPYIVRELKKTR